LSAALRPYVDSVDLVQSVHRSLLIGLRHDKFDISSPEKLLGLAVTIVRRKVARHWRRAQRQQRLSGFGGKSETLAEFLIGMNQRVSDPTASLMMRDGIERVLRELTATDRSLIALRLEGYTTAEACRTLRLNPDTTRRRLSRLRRRLKEIHVDSHI
jgi:RNA polymerase sigma-70 factor (ECF subfamily)